ncbi:MAG: sugar transferase [Candidatus Bruticola sp.]
MWNNPNGLLKRAFDIFASLAALVVLSPILLACAAAVLIDDGWPIFYVQERVGKRGRKFPFFKFRTMIRNAERLGSGYEISQNDSRITKTGAFLRRWSLDELPQLFNVLRGEMSLVGPRPTLAYQVETYSPHQRRRLEVLPGLTGLAQVSGRNSITWPERIELDIYYIDNYSFGLDCQIMLRTVGVLCHGDEIYGYGWLPKAEQIAASAAASEANNKD